MTLFHGNICRVLSICIRQREILPWVPRCHCYTCNVNGSFPPLWIIAYRKNCWVKMAYQIPRLTVQQLWLRLKFTTDMQNIKQIDKQKRQNNMLPINRPAKNTKRISKTPSPLTNDFRLEWKKTTHTHTSSHMNSVGPSAMTTACTSLRLKLTREWFSILPWRLFLLSFLGRLGQRFPTEFCLDL